MKNLIFTASIAVLTACNTANTTQKANTTTPTTQTTTKTVWDKNYGGADKSYDTELLALREKIAPKFQQFSFKDEKTGIEMIYNLFVPKEYQAGKSYPLVMFIPDASTVGKATNSGLMQGYGGIIWATDESQNENPSFVLVPYVKGPDWGTNDNWQVSAEAETIIPLLNSVVEKYGIDKNRIYTTGQSMGGMLSFHFNVKYPDLFAASIFVGSQWDNNLLSVLKDEKFFYIVSAGDPKASNGMQLLKDKFKAENISFAQTEFSAKLPEKEQNKYIENLLKEGNTHNFVLFEKGSTLPANLQTPPKAGEHMYSFDYAYKIKAVRDWLFKQSK